MERNKLTAYFGFAKRAGQLTLGVNATACGKKFFLLAADLAASPNTKKEISKLRERFACPLVWLEDLGELVKKEGCKLAAVRSESLSQAILAQTEQK